jgi:hypothetical protein
MSQHQRQEEWIVTDEMGEYVAYFNTCGTVMHFTKSRNEARRTADFYEASEITRIARDVYNRRFMETILVMSE